MTSIVDAYNCLHAAGKMLHRTGPVSLRAFCEWCEHAPGKMILVMDGVRKPHEPGMAEFPKLCLVFSGRGAKADPLIARMVREASDRSSSRGNVRVVSSDKAVMRQARGERVTAITSEEFLTELFHRLAAREPRFAGLPEMPGKDTNPFFTKTDAAEKKNAVKSSPQTNYWLKLFGFAVEPDSSTAVKTPAPQDMPPVSTSTRLSGRLPVLSGRRVAAPIAKENVGAVKPLGKSPVKSAESASASASKQIPLQSVPLDNDVELADLNLDTLLGPVKPLKRKYGKTRALLVRRKRRLR